MKTRLLFIVNSLCTGGAEKQVVSLLNQLDPTRHVVTLVYLKEERSLLGQIDRTQCAGGIVGLNVSRGLRLAAVREIARRIDDEAIDVVVCTNMYALLYGWLARRLARRGQALRLVEVFHTTLPGSSKEAWQMQLYRHLVRDVDLMIYVCQAQADHWRRWGLRPRREAVIHNGIDIDHFTDRWSDTHKQALRQRHGFTSQDLLVGLCAVMRPEKAHVDLLEALASLEPDAAVRRDRTHRTPSRLCALLIGDGPQRAAVEQRIRALGLDDRVRVTGLLQDVRPCIAACDVMVIPSRKVETFSIAALESMALGKPMVMTDIGGARELVRPGEHGWLVPPGEVPALASALRRMQDPQARRRMGEAAAQHVRRHFPQETMARAYERALRSLLGEPVSLGSGWAMRS